MRSDFHVSKVLHYHATGYWVSLGTDCPNSCNPSLSQETVQLGVTSFGGSAATYQLFIGATRESFGMGAVVAKAKAAEQFGASQLAASFKWESLR